MKLATFMRWVTLIVFVGLQLAVLFAIGYEAHAWSWLVIIMASLSVMLLLAHAKLPLHQEGHLYEDVRVAIWVPVGGIITYVLSVPLDLGPVLAASAVGLLTSYLPDLLPKYQHITQLPVAIYCGAFVGMSSSHVAGSFWFVLVASCVTAVFLIVSKSLFNGIGGKLGTLAFGGVALTSLCYYLLAS